MISKSHHCQEETKLRVQVDHITVSEDELWFSFLLTLEYNSNLLSSHGEYRQLDTIKLIKTTPRARLSQTCNKDYLE